jgi:hypothetical protein
MGEGASRDARLSDLSCLVSRVNRGGRSYQLETVIRIMYPNLFFSHIHLDPSQLSTYSNISPHVTHILPTGSTHRIPFPRRLRVPPCRRHSCPSFRRPLLVSRSAGRWRDRATAMATPHRHHDPHQDGGFRRSCAGRALQVPRALFRSRMRLFCDRKLGWVAILSQFVTLSICDRDQPIHTVIP